MFTPEKADLHNIDNMDSDDFASILLQSCLLRIYILFRQTDAEKNLK